MRKILLSLLVILSMGLTTVSADTPDVTVEAPAAHGPTPTEGQLKYYKEELAAFMHFGMNTFTGKEWGNGKEDPKNFNPTALDAEQWVKVFDEIGFKRLIMVGKHHDGFNIWPSKYTEHSVKNSPWKDGKGDLLEEVSAAATKYDMNMGFYLSPWDAHEPSYGDSTPGDYNEFYLNQLEEVLGNPKYGNDGKWDEVWMDGAKGAGVEYQTYNFKEWFAKIKSHNPDTVIFSPYGTEVRWIGNENGIAGVPAWQRVSNKLLRDKYDNNLGEDNKYLNEGQADGEDWSVGEADVSIRPGWFYHENQSAKSLTQLMDIYFKSVGRGVPLLLNVPADKRGLLADADIARLREFKAALDGTFTNDLSSEGAATATAIRGGSADFHASKVLDGDYDTYWTMDDGVKTGSITIDLGEPKLFDIVEIQEYIPLGQRIENFTVDVEIDGQWMEFGSGQTIGYKQLLRGPQVTASKVRVNITGSQAVPLLNNISVYKADKSIEDENSVPIGLKAIDNKEAKNSGGWTAENSSTLNNTSMWSSQVGATSEYTFTGTKAYVYGTVDRSHGVMEVLIDGVKVADVDTSSNTRSMAALLYTTDTLENKEHTLTVRVKGEKGANNVGTAIGLDGVYYLDNNGAGIFEVSPREVDVDEGESVEITVTREGGSNGSAEVTVITAPGTGVHGRHYVDKTEVLKFEDGETVKTVTLDTVDNDEVSGEINFYGEIQNPKNGAILGFRQYSKITIIDNDTIFDNAHNVATEAPTAIEAEDGTLIGDAQIENKAEASGGNVVGWLGKGNSYEGSLEFLLNVETAGKYTVDTDIFYGSDNVLKYEVKETATEGAITLKYSGGPNGEFAKTSFEIELAKGLNTLKLYNDEGGAPNIDKVTFTYQIPPVEKEDLETAIEKASEYAKEDYTTASYNNLIDAIADAQLVFANEDATQSEVDAAITKINDAVAKLVSIHTNSEENPFILSSEGKTTIEAEDMQLFGRAEIESVASASNGARVGWIGKGTSYEGWVEAYIKVDKAGTYAVDSRIFLGSNNKLKFESVTAGVDQTLEIKYNGGPNGEYDNVITKFELPAGVHKFKIYNDEGDAPNLDKFDFEFVEPLNYEELEKAIEAAEVFVADDYTEATFKKLEAEINKAKALLTNEDATQALINKQVTALNAAIASLEEVTPPVITVDTEALEAAIAKAKDVKKEDYTEDSYATLEAALEKATTALESKDQAVIDAAEKELSNAIDGLVELPPVITLDTEALEAAISKAKNVKKEDYTKDSYAALKAALEKATTALESKDQTVIDAAEKALNEAIDGLVEVTPPAVTVDTEALQAAIARAKNVKQEDYTKDSYATLKTALEKATTAVGSKDQAVIDAAEKALNEAIEALIKVAPPAITVDTKELEAKIAEAKALKEENYTEESYINLKEAIAKAEVALTSNDEKLVQDAIEGLNTTIKNLVEVKTDFPIIDKPEEKDPITPEDKNPVVPEDKDTVTPEEKLPTTGVGTNYMPHILIGFAGFFFFMSRKHKKENEQKFLK